MEQLLTHLHHLEQGWTREPAISAIKTRVHRRQLHISGQDEGASRIRRAVRGCSRQADLRGVRGSLKTPLTAACSQSDLCAELKKKRYLTACIQLNTNTSNCLFPFRMKAVGNICSVEVLSGSNMPPESLVRLVAVQVVQH